MAPRQFFLFFNILFAYEQLVYHQVDLFLSLGPWVADKFVDSQYRYNHDTI
jgi:hypothetical protein